MLRAFSSAVSGMRSQMNYMDVVANNIANVNTTGFKSVRARFADMLYQTFSGAFSGNVSGAGGVNPIQMGLGVRLAATDNMMTEGALQATGNPLDLAIEGDGMFALKDSGGSLFYTRDGAFAVDSNNFLVNPATGMRVQDDAGADIKIDMTKYAAISIAADGQIIGTKLDGTGTDNLQKIGLTTFPNLAGLSRASGNMWVVSSASGASVKVDMTQAGHANIRSGVLEGSNTDLATEFSSMVAAQRAFQANARVITTSDEILQDLVNIKH